MKNEMVKKILLLVIVAVVAGGLGFWGGSVYSSSKSASSTGTNAARAAAFAGGARSGRTGASAFGGALTGTILSKDATGLTVQNRAGGSSIVFLAPSTTVSKPTDVTVDSLNVGDNVVVMGKANPDGSIMAASIQVRPPQPTGAASGTPGQAPTPAPTPALGQ